MNKPAINVGTIGYIDQGYISKDSYITVPGHKEYLKSIGFPPSRISLVSLIVRDILDREYKTKKLSFKT